MRFTTTLDFELNACSVPCVNVIQTYIKKVHKTPSITFEPNKLRVNGTSVDPTP